MKLERLCTFFIDKKMEKYEHLSLWKKNTNKKLDF